MKVALVSFYLMESTIPLAKYLSLEGIDIDLYSLLPHGDQNTFVFDFMANEQPNGFVDSEITRATMGEKLHNYLCNVNTKIFIFPDKRLETFFFKDMYYAYLLAKYLKKRKYDLVHIIHSDSRFWFFLNYFLRKKKIVQTLHEVTSHEANNSHPEIRRLNWLIKKSTPIIFHSHISKERYIEFRKTVTTKKVADDNLAMIRFGLFETYHCFSNKSISISNTEKINILYFGRIVPYKGIHILIEAFKILQDKYPIHLIVAGSGEPYFDFKDIKSYEFINRHISNEEIVNLIEACDMVVLPYTSASQSGIPMTAYCFNKPIVASNIAGLREVIDHLKTGILVDDLNDQSLASSIEMLVENSNLKRDMGKNIKKKYTEGEFSWSSIAEKTIKFYQKQLDIKDLQ